MLRAIVDLNDLHRVLNIVATGDETTRRELAAQIVRERPRDLIAALVATARSTEPLLLRSRCLEILSLVSRDGDEATFRMVMEAFRAKGR